MKAGLPTTNRRDFIRKSASGLVVGAALPGVAYASSVSGDRMIKQEGVIVFQGLSILIGVNDFWTACTRRSPATT